MPITVGIRVMICPNRLYLATGAGISALGSILYFLLYNLSFRNDDKGESSHPETPDEKAASRKGKPIQSTQVQMIQTIHPIHTDSTGMFRAGCMLAMVDETAGVAAKYHTGQPCVTASIDSVNIIQTLLKNDHSYQNYTLVITARVNRVWNSSLEIGVRVDSEDLNSGERLEYCHATLTFVVKPSSVKSKKHFVCPKVFPETFNELKVFSEADNRREEKLKARKNAIEKTNFNSAFTFAFYDDNVDRTAVPPHDAISVIIDDGDLKDIYGVEPETARNNTIQWDVSSRTTKASYTRNVNLVMPQHANSLGVTFGGHIVELMESAALVAAARHFHGKFDMAESTRPSAQVPSSSGKGKNSKIPRNPGVRFQTISIDTLNFMAPTYVGDILDIRAYVSRSWNTSMEIYVTVHAKSAGDYDDSIAKFTNDGYLTVVVRQTVSEHNLVRLPRLIPQTQVELDRFRSAQKRREIRLANKELLSLW